MLKLKSKFLITLFIIMLLSFTTLSLPANANEIMPISDNLQAESTSSDLYISENQYDIKDIINGNVFASVGTLNIDSSNNGGVINGNLYATANTINIKSNVKYSKTEKDESGNFKLESVTNSSTIYGNVFVTANNFVLEPKCEINGDLYICANKIELAQGATIHGNVFVIGNTLSLNSNIDKGNLYANVKDFNMGYYSFIYRDLNLSAENANLNGNVYRNSFITADTIKTGNLFINRNDFNVNNASNIEFSGEVRGNANINSKNITFNSQDNNGQSITCVINGNLDYSSQKEIEIKDNMVLGDINFSKYTSPNNLLSNIGNYLLGLAVSLLYIIVIYLIINKLMPKYIEKLSNIDFSNILISLVIGIAILILAPILSIVLFITRIGSLLGLLLMILYILLLIIAKPIFVIVVSTMINKKVTSINTYVAILITTIALSLINLIPYVGFIVSVIVLLAGLGIFIRSLSK